MLPLFCPLAFLGFASVVGLYACFLYWPVVAVAVAISLALLLPLPALLLAPSSLLPPLVPAAPLPAAPGPVVGRGGDGAAVGDGGSA
eukprot:5236586-Alexandrium_andersonii.AAC.1